MNEALQARQYHQKGDLASAAAYYVRAIQDRPEDPQIRHDYAVLLMQTRREADAIPVFRSVLDDSPARPDTVTALALCLRATGNIENGTEIANRAVALDSLNPVAWLVKGSLELQSGAATAAEVSLRRCLAIAPRLGEGWHYLGEALQAQYRWQEAAHAYRQAMAEQPTEVMNVAICAELSGQLDIARDGYLRMCHLMPERSDCLLRLAQTEAMMCEFEREAEVVAKLQSKLQQSALLPSDDCMEAFPLSYLRLPDEVVREAIERYANRVKSRANALPPLPLSVHGSSRQVIRLGYLSPDFGNHAVGGLLRGFFRTHDRNQFEVYGYSLRPYGDDTANYLRKEFDHFRDCESLSTHAVASMIRNDGIDVLIDLGGYTHGSRPEIAALRPAPLQLGWLGFIHGQQAPWLDGLLLDEQVLPEPATWPYSDTPVRIPGFMLPAGQMPIGTADRARFGLPPDVPLLASFNNSYKLDAELVLAWISILEGASDAHLLVYLPRYARAGFLRYWQRHGGSTSRLHLADRLPAAVQADRAASCDLFLDAFRYQAGATAIASVAAGLPILSRVGATPLARLSLSLNRFLGLDSLVCSSTEAYVERALTLIHSSGALAQLRESMHEAMSRSRLLDPRRTSLAIEQTIIRVMNDKSLVSDD